MGNHTASGGTGAYAARARARASSRTGGGGAGKAGLPAEAKRGAPLKAIARDTTYREIDPFKPVDPHFLVQVYGEHQLARALDDLTYSSLKDAARAQGMTGLARSRDGLIAQITKHTTQDRYQGNLGPSPAKPATAGRSRAKSGSDKSAATSRRSGTGSKASKAPSETLRVTTDPAQRALAQDQRWRGTSRDEVDPFRMVNPWQLAATYPGQVKAALSQFTMDGLRYTAKGVEGYLHSRGTEVKIAKGSREAITSALARVVEQYPQQPFDLQPFVEAAVLS